MAIGLEWETLQEGVVMRVISITTAIAFSASEAFASGEFSGAEDAKPIANQMTTIIQSSGLDAAIDAMHDSSLPFAASQMGIHVFEQSIIVADNRELELIASSYADVQDLTGDTKWPRITAAADVNGEAVLDWYHYDIEAEYTFNC